MERRVKKIKLEKSFNILKVLYLENENRNILSEVLKQFDNSTMMNICKSFIDKTLRRRIKLCEQCFNSNKMLRQLKCVPKNKSPRNIHPMICDTCWISHYNTFTKVVKVETISKKTFIDVQYTDEMTISSTHTCAFKSKRSRDHFFSFKEILYIKKHRKDSNINLGSLLYYK